MTTTRDLIIANSTKLFSHYLNRPLSKLPTKITCPFHNEKTPSLMLYPPGNGWYCFGACNEGGSVIDFVAKLQSTSPAKAIEEMCRVLNIENDYGTEREGTDKRLTEVLEAAVATLHMSLMKADTAEKRNVLKYLEGRGVSRHVLEEYQIGLFPGRDALSCFLRKHFPDELLKKVGLTNPEGGDFFPKGIAFPIFTSGGYPVGFGCRPTENGNNAKYINTPSTPIFNKSSLLYGYTMVGSKGKNPIIVTEGYFDVLVYVSKHPGQKAFAQMGSTLTINQLKILEREGREFIYVPDTDKAGLAATLSLAKHAPMTQVVNLGKYHDLAEYALDDGPKILKVLSTAIDTAIDATKNTHDLTTARGKSDFVNEMGQYFYGLKAVEKAHYSKVVAKLSDTPESLIVDSITKNIDANNTTAVEVSDVLTDLKTADREMDLLTLIILANNEISIDLSENIFTDKSCGRLAVLLLNNDYESIENDPILSSMVDEIITNRIDKSIVSTRGRINIYKKRMNEILKSLTRNQQRRQNAQHIYP